MGNQVEGQKRINIPILLIVYIFPLVEHINLGLMCRIDNIHTKRNTKCPQKALNANNAVIAV
jgi:hypothetical protein